MKARDKRKEENQTENKTNETEVIENIGTADKQEENQTENKTNDTVMTENTGTTGEQKESSNNIQKPNTIPFMSPVSMIVAMIGTIVYKKKKIKTLGEGLMQNLDKRMIRKLVREK